MAEAKQYPWASHAQLLLRDFTGKALMICAACRGVLGKRGRVEGQWGGSILDSVVGVFLTQNVSDALSSKAWMNLAATFPLPAYKKDSLDSIDWESVRTAPVEKVIPTARMLLFHCRALA